MWISHSQCNALTQSLFHLRSKYAVYGVGCSTLCVALGTLFILVQVYYLSRYVNQSIFNQYSQRRTLLPLTWVAQTAISDLCYKACKIKKTKSLYERGAHKLKWCLWELFLDYVVTEYIIFQTPRTKKINFYFYGFFLLTLCSQLFIKNGNLELKMDLELLCPEYFVLERFSAWFVQCPKCTMVICVLAIMWYLGRQLLVAPLRPRAPSAGAHAASSPVGSFVRGWVRAPGADDLPARRRTSSSSSYIKLHRVPRRRASSRLKDG